jgi:putative membrane protein
MKTRLLIVASALALAACNHGADTTNTVVADDTAMTNDMTTTDNGMVADNDVAAAPMAAQDFVNAAASTDAFEIAEAKLALSTSKTQAVKDFANQMIKDHTASTAKLKTAAGTLKPDPTLSAEQQADVTALKAAGADAFDSTYKTQQLAAHQKALGVMQSYAAAGDNDDLKAFAAATATVVQNHLAMLQNM